VQNPPPKLEKLQVLFIDGYDHHSCGRLLNQLLKSCCTDTNLNKLSCPCIAYEPVSLPNLEEMEETIIAWNKLGELKEASPKLRKLIVSIVDMPTRDENAAKSDVDFDSDEEDYADDKSHIETIFKEINKFGGSLKELKLFSSNAIVFNDQSEDFKIELPKLKRLVFTYRLPAHHLEKLVSLKHLEIYRSPWFKDNSYCSDLFDMLPKLEKVVHLSDSSAKVQVMRQQHSQSKGGEAFPMDYSKVGE